jgi:hypothetical protein
MRRLVLALVCALAVPVLLSGSSQASRLDSPFKEFKFAYTSKKPDSPTGFRYQFQLFVPADGSQPPIVEQLNVTFAKGTKIDLGAVPACKADDDTITAQGPVICPTRSRLGIGTAKVWTGPGPLLDLDVALFSTGHGVVVAITGSGNVLAVIRGTLTGRRLTVAVPPIDIGPGAQAAIVDFNLPLAASGSARRPVFTTPPTCATGSWRTDYQPRFQQLGRLKLAYLTHCTT